MVTSLLLGAVLLAGQDSSVSQDWQLTAERTGFRQSGTYEEAVDFCRRLDRASGSASVIEFGQSPQGRTMIALLLSRDPVRAMDPVQRTKPLVFVQNGIHSGEIDGKDALLMMARKAVQDPQSREAKVLDAVDLLIVPVFSVDSHERRSPYNRANQNGPEEMGWRATANNLNLNRDYVKADAPEMRNLLTLAHRVKPDFMIDNHVTDGGDWQYVVQYDVPTGPTLDPGVSEISARYVRDVMPEVDLDGYLTAPYFSSFDENNPTRGIGISAFSPRYSTSYFATLNVPSLLVETHVLKDYRTRVYGTYSLNLRTFEWVSNNATPLLEVRRAADQNLLQEGSKVVLTARTSPEGRPFTFKGFRRDDYTSELTGGNIRRWTQEKVDYPTTIRDTLLPGLEVTAPAAYLVPKEFADVAAILKVHGITTEPVVMSAPRQMAFDMTVLNTVSFGNGLFEGRAMPQFRTAVGQRMVTVHPGDLLVPVSQPKGRLVVHMFEAEGPDSLLRWGFFNAFMEQKEYAEDYAMEPFAQKMLAENEELRKEFEERLKDPEFAGSPQARMRFFFERSPFYDSRYNVMPIVRLTKAQTDQLAGR